MAVSYSDIINYTVKYTFDCPLIYHSSGDGVLFLLLVLAGAIIWHLTIGHI